MKRWLTTALVSIGPILALGCGARSGDQPELGLVTGRVTLDGQPVEGVVVAFVPKPGRASTGLTDKNGNYALTYLGRVMGAKVGAHRVVITTPGQDDPDLAVEERIPKQYNSESTLSEEVKPGRNTFDFDLKSSPADQIAMPSVH